jgi:murein DD-endopeptidase MepM/ murein hydrolase activator NlpD
VVQKGETVYSLARSYKVSPESILAANGISDPTKVKVGQRLAIPQVHVVKKGDTLYGIARLYGVEVADLLSLNKLSLSSALKPSQVILLPQASQAAKTSVTPPKGDGQAGAEKVAVKPPDKVVVKPLDKAGPAPDPAFHPLVKTSSRQVPAKLALPCPGEARYLDGKIDGIVILCEKGVVSKAINSGRVVSAGPYRGFGLVVFVEGKSGYIYVYGGNDSLAVKVGDNVSPGMELGNVGFDAREGRPAAYFLVFRDGKSLDPASVAP